MADMPGNTQPRGADIEVWEDWPAGHGYDDAITFADKTIAAAAGALVDAMRPDTMPGGSTAPFKF